MRMTLAVMLLLVACNAAPATPPVPESPAPPVLLYEETIDETIIDVDNADEATEGLSASVGDASLSTDGGTAKRDHAAEQQSATLTWIGAALILVGVLTFAARFVPAMAFLGLPLGVSVSVVGAGIGFLFLPTIIDRLWWVLPVGIAAWVCISYGPAIYDNVRQRRKQEPPADA